MFLIICHTMFLFAHERSHSVMRPNQAHHARIPRTVSKTRMANVVAPNAHTAPHHVLPRTNVSMIITNMQYIYIPTIYIIFPLKLPPHRKTTTVSLYQVGRVLEVFQPNKALLNTPDRHKPVEDTHASRLVVGAAPPCTTERLLADNGACALFVIIHITSSVA
jgi:hypothetical protein